MIRFRMRPAAFKRLRTKTEALVFSQGDRQTVVLRLLDSVHNAQVKRAFASRGATVASGPWAPWSPKYALWRRRHRSRLGNRMMRLTDTLYEKSTSPFHGGHLAIWRGRLRYAFGFADDVGFWHHHGEGRLPVRSVIHKTEADRQEFVRRFVAFYIARIRQALR